VINGMTVIKTSVGKLSDKQRGSTAREMNSIVNNNGRLITFSFNQSALSLTVANTMQRCV